jgi:SAM-dependent methyltransferase
MKRPWCPGGDNPRMPWFTTVSAEERHKADLAYRLRKLEKVFRIPELQREKLPNEQVIAYFEHCHEAYRKYHSAEGSVHMALNDGDRYDPDGFYGQARIIEQAWQPEAPTDVMEIAFGQGFNLGYLAKRHPQRRFGGIDLTPAHLDLARTRMQREGLSNVTLGLGDLHQLPYADASFDEVFCIEAFCYARDLDQALGEVARVLKPGGRYTLFDGYLLKPRR